jgi:hypothetical protein
MLLGPFLNYFIMLFSKSPQGLPCVIFEVIRPVRSGTDLCLHTRNDPTPHGILELDSIPFCSHVSLSHYIYKSLKMFWDVVTDVPSQCYFISNWLWGWRIRAVRKNGQKSQKIPFISRKNLLMSFPQTPPSSYRWTSVSLWEILNSQTRSSYSTIRYFNQRRHFRRDFYLVLKKCSEE